MTNIFYDHLIVFDEIITILDKNKLTLEEHQEILSIVDQHIHHEVLDIILTKLPKEKHGHFLQKFHANPTDQELMTYLKKEINQDFENQLRDHINTVTKDLLKEIKLASKTK